MSMCATNGRITQYPANQPITTILFLLERTFFYWIHFKSSLIKICLGSDYGIRLKLKKSIFFAKNYNCCKFEVSRDVEAQTVSKRDWFDRPKLNIYLKLYFHFFILVSRQSAA